MFSPSEEKLEGGIEDLGRDKERSTIAGGTEETKR